MYSATKSSVIFFSYASRFQLKDKNISVSCLAPGPVYTKPQTENETEKQLGWFGSRMALSPKRVGEIAVRQTLNKKMMTVPGTLPGIMSSIIRILPRRWIAGLCYNLGKR